MRDKKDVSDVQRPGKLSIWQAGQPKTIYPFCRHQRLKHILVRLKGDGNNRLDPRATVKVIDACANDCDCGNITSELDRRGLMVFNEISSE